MRGERDKAARLGRGRGAAPLLLSLLPCLAGAAGAALVPARAAAADCRQPNATDQIFAHPYGEPPPPCQPEAASTNSLDNEAETILQDDRGPRKLKSVGIAGLEAGASVAGVGGLLLLVSVFMADHTKGHAVTKWGGIGIASAGGAIFLAGGVLVGIDYLAAPAPTPDRKGAQLMLAFRF